MLATSQKVMVTAEDTPRGLSRRGSALSICKSTVIKDLQTDIRYLPDLISRFIELTIRIAFFLLLSQVIAYKNINIGGAVLSGKNLFVFLQGGLLLFVFNGTALGRPVNAVTRDLTNGTLEYLYATPSSRYAYFVGTIISSALINVLLFFPIYVFLVFYSNASLVNMLMVLLACLTALVAIVALGIMIALLAILWRQVGSITAFIGLLFEFLSGAYIPVSAFPPFVRFASYLLPYTWANDLIRYYSFEGRWTTGFPIWIEWITLISYAVLFTLISRFLLKKTEQRAKKSGLHVL